MVGKKTATDQIKRSIGERQGERVGYNSLTTWEASLSAAIVCGKVRAGPIQQGNLQGDSAPRQIQPD
jgi:hypothetical protein